MKIRFLLICSLLSLSCSQKEENVRLQEGQPLYILAKSLASKLPYLDPDENNVLVKTRDFSITTGDLLTNLHERMGTQLNQLTNFSPSRLKQTLEQTAREYAERKLLLQQVQANGIHIEESEVDSVLNGQFARSGGQDKYMQFLEHADISMENVRQQIVNGLSIQRFLKSHLSSEITVTEEEIQEAYQQDKTATVRHILLLTEGKSESEKSEIRQKMEGILARARNGEDFAELAKKYSEDPGSKNKGGLYENFGRGRMVKPFEDAAFSVPIGEISDIVETRYGYHIIKVVDRQKETRPLEEVRAELEASLKNQKFNEAYERYVAKLRSDAGFEMMEF